MTTTFTTLRTVAVWTLAIAAVGLGLSCRTENRERIRPGLRSSPVSGPIVHTYPGAKLQGAFAVWGAGDGIGRLSLVKHWPLVVDDPDSVLRGSRHCAVKN